MVVTCTTSPRPLLGLAEITPGTFVAAVGADNEHKLEIEPSLMRSARVVVDVLEQCATIGDLRGAIAAGLMTRDDVHAELPELVSGRRPGREWDEQVFIFDSTGSAVQDVAAAGAVYQQALERGAGARITLAS